MKDGYPLVSESNREIAQTFLNSSPISLVSISTLHFAAVKLSDTGWYECIVDSVYHESASLLSSESTYLSVHETSELTPIATTATPHAAPHNTTTSGVHAILCLCCTVTLDFYFIFFVVTCKYYCILY